MGSSKGATLLIVDADADVRESLASFLGFDLPGVRVLESDSADGALQTMLEENVDVILVDQRLPGPTGLDLLRAAKAHGQLAKRILMSSTHDPRLMEAAVNEVGVDGFFFKPLEPAPLADLIRRILHQGRMERAVRDPARGPA